MLYPHIAGTSQLTQRYRFSRHSSRRRSTPEEELEVWSKRAGRRDNLQQTLHSMYAEVQRLNVCGLFSLLLLGDESLRYSLNRHVQHAVLKSRII